MSKRLKKTAQNRKKKNNTGSTVTVRFKDPTVWIESIQRFFLLYFSKKNFFTSICSSSLPLLESSTKISNTNTYWPRSTQLEMNFFRKQMNLIDRKVVTSVRLEKKLLREGKLQRKSDLAYSCFWTTRSGLPLLLPNRFVIVVFCLMLNLEMCSVLVCSCCYSKTIWMAWWQRL